MASIFRHAVLHTMPIIGSWTTTQLAQSTTVRATAGALYYVDWGDGTVETFTGNGADQVHVHNYALAGTYRQTWKIADATKLLRFYCGGNLLSGPAPSLATFTALSVASFFSNQLAGVAPSLLTNSLLTEVRFNSNLLTGNPPALSGNPGIGTALFNNNQLTGSIPSLAANTSLVTAYYYNNQLTGYTASTIATTCTALFVSGNLMTLAALTQILTDFFTNIAARPAVVTLDLGGTGNAALDAAALATKAAIIALRPGWVITNN